MRTSVKMERIQTMLKVDQLQAGYGLTQVLFDISFQVPEGSVVSLLGRNGMGKTTTIKTLMGMIKPMGGNIAFYDHSLTDLLPHQVARVGLGLVPEGRQIFPNLTVRENLIATAHKGILGQRQQNSWDIDRVFTMFPSLKERQANMGDQLSGGEQQMLAIGRALMTNPRLLILDEATEGLAPLIRQSIWDCLAQLKADGQSILVVDKNLDALLRLADHHFIIEKGHVVWHGPSESLAREPEVQERYLGV